MLVTESFNILGLNQDASMIEVKNAYKKLIRKYHPDLYTNNTEYLPQAIEMTKKLNLAVESIEIFFSQEKADFADSYEEEAVYSFSKSSKFSNQNHYTRTHYYYDAAASVKRGIFSSVTDKLSRCFDFLLSQSYKMAGIFLFFIIMEKTQINSTLRAVLPYFF